MSKKYILTNESKNCKGHTLYRIQALKDFDDIKSGDLGGFVESENNLSHEGNCWVYNEAKIFENACVYGNAKIYDNVRIYGNSTVYDNSKICNFTHIFGNSQIFNNARIRGEVWISGNVKISGYARIEGYIQIYDNVCISDYAEVHHLSKIFNNAKILDNAFLDDKDVLVDEDGNKYHIEWNNTYRCLNPVYIEKNESLWIHHSVSWFKSINDMKNCEIIGNSVDNPELILPSKDKSSEKTEVTK